MKEVSCDSAPTNSSHLFLRWAWLHFITLNLDERSLYLRHEGHEMMLKFITPRQASKDKQRLEERIEKQKNRKRTNISIEGREIEEKENEVKIKMMEKAVQKECV